MEDNMPTTKVKLNTLKDYQKMVKSGHVIYIDRYINPKALKQFRKQQLAFMEAHPNAKAVAIVIMSPGGEVDYASHIINEMKALRSMYDIWTVAGADVASAAVNILLSVPVNRRVALPYTAIYNHKAASSTIEKSNVSVPEMKNANRESSAIVRYVERIEKESIAILVKQTNLSKKEAKKLYKKPRYIYSKEAVKLGFVSHILA